MKALTLIAVLALSGCAPAAASKPVNAADITRELETLDRIEAFYGLVGGKTGLRIRVASNGCTRKEDFGFAQPAAGPLGEGIVQFTRHRPDTCQSFAMGSTWLEFSYAELGFTPQTRIRVANPVVAWTGPGE